jgi:hypothetical protein
MLILLDSPLDILRHLRISPQQHGLSRVVDHIVEASLNLRQSEGSPYLSVFRLTFMLLSWT